LLYSENKEKDAKRMTGDKVYGLKTQKSALDPVTEQLPQFSRGAEAGMSSQGHSYWLSSNDVANERD